MLLAIVLELPEQYFTKRKFYNGASEKYLRCMNPVKLSQDLGCWRLHQAMYHSYLLIIVRPSSPLFNFSACPVNAHQFRKN